MIIKEGQVAIGTNTLPTATKLNILDGHVRLSDGYKIDWGGTNVGIDGNNSSDYFRIFTSSTERLRVDTDGNVGINYTDPQSKLDVSLGGDGSTHEMNSTGVNNLLTIRVGSNEDPASVANAGAKWGMRLRGFINDASNPNRKTAAVYAVSEDAGAGYNRKVGMALHTSPFDADHVERVRIDCDGLVGIATGDPKSRLHVYGDAVNNASHADYGIAAFENVNREGLSIGYDADDNYTYLYSREVGVASRGLRLNESIYIDDLGGEVGIGTTAPQKNLDIVGQFMVRPTTNTTVGRILFASTSSHSHIEIKNASSVNKVFLNSNGNSYFDGGSLGVGMNAPSARLELKAGTSDSSASAFIARNSSSTSLFSIRNDGRVDIPVGPVVVDTDTLYVDTSNDRVGIGTSAPSYDLDVVGTTRSTYYIGGAYLEENASSSKLKFYKDGTVLVIDEDGELKPCDKENDTLVFGVSKIDFDSPVVLGAEPILVTGPIKVGDYIVTSSKQGHGQAMKEQKLGTIIAQAMENGDGESYNIKAVSYTHLTLPTILLV